MITRCAWVNDDPLNVEYHDQEWGVPVFDAQKLFEFLVLEGMQAGLSWITILKKRDNYRRLFDNFNAEKIVKYRQAKIDRLCLDPGIIRSRLKINAIVNNAKVYLAHQDDFSELLWSFVGGAPITNRCKTQNEVPVSTEASEKMSKTLKKMGFKFVGPTICYAFMQAVGMVNDHTIDCFRYNECSSRRKGAKK